MLPGDRDPAATAPASPPAASLVGAVLDGKYRIEAVIGSGSMGTVYRAHHLTLESGRAIKVMRAELARNAAFVERFQREARILEDLRHPHLVALYDFARLPSGAWYIVSELVEGETLAARLEREGRMAPAELAPLLEQIVDGVAAAHARGIVHRDLSPDNIMISSEPEGPVAKVLDFGVAKEALREQDGSGGYSLTVGKLGYAAPEQIGLVPETHGIDQRADVFSLAAVLYRALGGRLPWRTSSVQAYVHDLLIRPESDLAKTLADDIEARWRRLLLRGLARDPRRRTPDVATLGREFALALAPAPARAAHRWLWAALGTAGLAAATILALLSPLGRHAPEPAQTPVTVASRTSSEGAARALPDDALPPPTEAEDSRPRPSTPAAAATARAERSPMARGTVAAATTATPAPEATPLPAATFDLSSDPPAAAQIDGRSVGRTPLRLHLEPGRHRVLLVSPDGEEHSQEVTLAAGEASELNHRFAGFGRLAIIAEPWMEVSVDGGDFAETPLRLEKVAAGRHVIEGRRPGYQPVRVEAVVEKGQTRSVRIEPKPVPGSR